MQKGFYLRNGNLLIQGDRLLLVLTPKEVIDAVLQDEELFIRSCKRGKSELRYMKNEQRMQKDEARLADQIRKDEADMMQDAMMRE